MTKNRQLAKKLYLREEASEYLANYEMCVQVIMLPICEHWNICKYLNICEHWKICQHLNI